MSCLSRFFLSFFLACNCQLRQLVAMQLSSLATLGRIAAFASLAAADAASDLSAALSGYPQLNDLRTLVDHLPGVVNTIIGDKDKITVLAPSDGAFQTYALTHDGAQLF